MNRLRPTVLPTLRQLPKGRLRRSKMRWSLSRFRPKPVKTLPLPCLKKASLIQAAASQNLQQAKPVKQRVASRLNRHRLMTCVICQRAALYLHNLLQVSPLALLALRQPSARGQLIRKCRHGMHRQRRLCQHRQMCLSLHHNQRPVRPLRKQARRPRGQQH